MTEENVSKGKRPEEDAPLLQEIGINKSFITIKTTKNKTKKTNNKIKHSIYPQNVITCTISR